MDEEALRAWAKRREELLISEGLLPAPTTPEPEPPQPPSQAPRRGITALPYQYIAVLLHPSTRTFTDALDNASWSLVLGQYVALPTIFCAIQYIAGILLPLHQPDNARLLLPYILILWFSIILSFAIIEGLIYLLARIFKGEGTLLEQAYASLLSFTPSGILISLVLLIPNLGIPLVLIVILYSLVLRFLSLMAVHQLSEGKTLAVFCTALGFSAFCGCCLLPLFIRLAAFHP